MACWERTVCCTGITGTMSRMTGCSASIAVRSITLGWLAAAAFLLVFQFAAPAYPALFIDDQLLTDQLLLTNKEAPVADRANADIVETNVAAETNPAKFAAASKSLAVAEGLAVTADS